MKTNHCLLKQKRGQLGGKAYSEPSKRRVLHEISSGETCGMTCQTYVVDIIKNISWFPGELWTIAWKGSVLKVAKQKPHMVQKFPDIKGVGGQKRIREISHVCDLFCTFGYY